MLNAFSLAVFALLSTVLLVGCSEKYDPEKLMKESRAEECPILNEELYEEYCVGKSAHLTVFILARKGGGEYLVDLGHTLQGRDLDTRFILNTNEYIGPWDKANVKGVYTGMAAFSDRARFNAVSASAIELSYNERKAKRKAETFEKYKDDFSIYDGSHFGLVNVVKNRLKDPESFNHVETTYENHGDYLRVNMTFRGTNSFGAVVTQEVSAKVVPSGKVIEISEVK